LETLNTKYFSHLSQVDEAAEILRRGGLLGLPTETVYGLGANALDEEAVSQIFVAKGRPQDNPLILHIPDAGWLERYCEDVPPEAYDLAREFWPGPLTMVLTKKDCVPLRTTGGLSTVGVRCPDHPAALAILRAADIPIAAPSGNTSGRPSPTTAAHMLEDMDGKIHGIFDGGPCRVGVESTIVDLTVSPPRLLRPGGLPLEELQRVLGEVAVDKAVTEKLSAGEKPRAPGMKYRHYAPKSPVTVVCGAPERTAAYIAKRITPDTGVICFSDFAHLFPNCTVRELGALDDPNEQARRVFDALRAFDTTQVTEIYAQCPDTRGLGLAVSNRLKKAAGFCVVEVGRMRILGITGGSGAGKTTVLELLREYGAEILDCDRIYARMVREDAPLRSALEQAFGPVFLPSGDLDRHTLAQRVFGNAAELETLNALVYRHLGDEVRRLLREAASAGTDLAAIDAVNLIDSGLGALCDKTVAVLAPREVRLARIMERDGIDRTAAEARIDAQHQEEYYKAHCHILLENAGDLAALKQTAAALLADELPNKEEKT